MGNEFRYLCLVETRRLLLLMGVVFGLILFVQYLELPYSNILSSLLAAGKSHVGPIDNLPNRNSSSYTMAPRSWTNLSIVNSTEFNVGDDISNTGKVSHENVTNVKDDLDPAENRSLNDTLRDDVDPEDESPFEDFIGLDHNSTIEMSGRNNSFSLNKTGDSDGELPISNYTLKNGALLDHDGSGGSVLTSQENEDKASNSETLAVPRTPSNLQSTFPENSERSSSTYVNSTSGITSTGKDTESILQDNENPKILKARVSAPVINHTISNISPTKEGITKPAPAIVPIQEMNAMLCQSRVSYRAVKPQWSSAVDQELLNTRLLIENAPIIRKDPQFDTKLYLNFTEFKRSYELMEQTLKVYIYAEGERPIFHQPPLKGIYASEGWFMKLLKANKRFVAKKPERAHLFYLPFSSRALEVNLYVPNSHSRTNLIEHLRNYVEMIKEKYKFWNRTSGADHFLVACHDWAPAETREIMANCIRSLCNADIRGGFQFGKDVSLPETSIKSPQNPLRQLGGKPASRRPILAFFAGNMHGYLRPILLNYWENKDPDIKVFGHLSKTKGQMSYAQYMKSSRYCICARGYEVNSPRVVEAIFYECVPVIISDNFVPPFFETLNWESFAVFVLEKDIPNLKNILMSISKKRYLKMQQRVKQVQQHFLWHARPVKYDVFHMILHSIWYTRVFQARSW